MKSSEHGEATYVGSLNLSCKYSQGGVESKFTLINSNDHKFKKREDRGLFLFCFVISFFSEFNFQILQSTLQLKVQKLKRMNFYRNYFSIERKSYHSKCLSHFFRIPTAELKKQKDVGNIRPGD